LRANDGEGAAGGFGKAHLIVAMNYFELGLAHLESGVVRKALEAFAACGPGDARAMTMSGAALARLGEPSRAEAAFRKAIEMEPSEELFYVSYAGFLAGEKKSSEAEATGAQGAAHNERGFILKAFKAWP